MIVGAGACAALVHCGGAPARPRPEPIKPERGEEMLQTNVRGLSIAYQRVGKGPALVLLHGFTQDSRVWRPQLETLSDAFTVIAWDAPGAGRSADPPETFTIGDWAGCLAGLLDACGIEQAHVLGLSWGGLLAQELYAGHTRRVKSLVLAGTYAGWTGSLTARVAEERLAACLRDAALPPREFVPKYLPGMFADSVNAETKEELATIMYSTHPVGFRSMATALARADTRELLPAIHVPTLLVWGDADKRSPMNVAHQFRDAISSARLAVIPGAGHVSNLEAPKQFNSIVREFLLGNG
jgi:pimeloyl-ACP methyl ester carboxylesterase